ncbi:MAG: phosphodiesterase [Aestuariivirga sp.]
MKFIHLTDLHLVPPTQKLWGLDPFARLELCLADIEKYHGDAAFCAISGDLTERGEAATYKALQARLKTFSLPVHLMLGNHDDRGNFLKVFGGPLEGGFVQHRLIAGGQHLLFLDTLKGGLSSAGLYDEPRRKWLRTALADADGAPVHIFMHHPPFKIHHPLMDLIPLEDGEGFGDLLAGHNVRHLFFGHAHRTISGQWRSISYSALPGLNHQLPLVNGSVPTIYSNEPAMYSVVHLRGDQITVHSDAFMDRAPAQMAVDAERGGWN